MAAEAGSAAASSHPPSAQRFETLVDSIRDYAIFMLSPEGTVLTWNRGAQRLKGYAPDEIIGHSFERFYTDEQRRAGLPQRLLTMARSEGRVEDEGWRVRKDGSRFWADVVITTLRDETQHVIGYAKVTRDLTERRHADEQLRQSEERFRTLVDTIKDYAIFLLSPQGEVLTWNQGARGLKGYASNEIIGHSFECFYTDEQRLLGLPQRLLATARAEGRVEDEGWRVRKDGSRFWADVVITRLVDDNARLIGYAKVTRDLTARRLAEQDRARRVAAERSAVRFERLQVATAALAAANRPEEAARVLIDVGMEALGAASGAIAVPTPDGTALEVRDVRGDPASALRINHHFQPGDPSPLAQAWRTSHAVFVKFREQIEADDPAPTATPTDAPFRLWAAVPLMLNRQILGVLGLRFDQPRELDLDERGLLLALAEVGAQAIERARLYGSEQRSRSEAEAAVRAQDEFLSVAAHELRTPVAVIKATAQLAARTIARGHFTADTTARHLQSIAGSADRLGALIEDLLDVSRLRTGRLRVRREQVELNSLVEEIVRRYDATETHHQFNLTLPEPCVVIDADPLRIEQVLDNLLSNAVKYAPNGGAVDIYLGADAGGVTLTVTDRGIGLRPGEESRIFEPFGRGSNANARQIQGLGLGLAICRQLVEIHGGHISASSLGDGLGTTLEMWLPRTEADGHDPPDPDHG